MKVIDIVKILSCARTYNIVLQILGEETPNIDLSKLDQRLIPLLLMIAKHETLINEAESQVEAILTEMDVEIQNGMYT